MSDVDTSASGLSATVVRTAALVPIRWDDDDLAPSDLAGLLVQRTVQLETASWHTWRLAELDKVRMLVQELTPAMQRMLGLHPDAEQEGATVVLELHPDAHNAFFNAVSLVVGRTKASLRFLQPQVSRVRLFVLGAGVGMCVLDLDWTDGGRSPMAIDDVVVALDTLRSATPRAGRPGWLLAAPRVHPKATWSTLDQVAPQRRESLGDAVCAAKHCGQPMGLAALIDVLLLMPGEEASAPPRRARVSSYVTLHSAVVVDRAPRDAALATLLWRLRRGYGPSYSSPESAPAAAGARPPRDVVMAPRGNRLVAVAREGAVALSWPEPGGSDSFETEDWPRRFQRFYLVLALQVQAERLTLARLSDRLSARVQAVARTQRKIDADPRCAAALLASARNRLRDDATAVVNYTLALSTEDVGGVTEYADFHEALQEVWRIPRQRAELRAEVADVLGLIEAWYGQVAELLAALDSKARERADRRNRRFELAVGVVGAITLPLALLAGWYGMNMYGEAVTPPGRGWVGALAVVGGILILSGVYAVFRDDDP